MNLHDDKRKLMNLTTTFLMLIAGLAAVVGSAGVASADTIADQIRTVTAKAAPSLVIVSFYVEQDDGSRAEVRIPGCVVAEGNLVMTTSVVFNNRVPLEQYKNFEVLVGQGSELKAYAAAYQGRDDTAQVAFLRITAEDAPTIPVLAFDAGKTLDLGDAFVSFANLGEADAYKLAINLGRVSTVLDKPFRMYLVTGAVGTPGMPVITLEGQVVGILGLHAMNRGTASRPNAQAVTVVWPAERFAERLANVPTGGRQIKRPWLGIASMTPVNRDVATFFGLGEERGVIIGQVIEGSPAAAADLKSEDIVLAIGDKKLLGAEGQLVQFFQNEIQQCKIGQEVELLIFRGGQRKNIKLTLGEEPKSAADAKFYRNRQFGFNVREMVLQDTIARELPGNEPGVVVDFVEGSGWAQDGGLQRGDIIKRVQDQPVKDLAEFEKAFDETSAKKPREVVLFVLRGAKDTRVLRLEPRWTE